jgi:hypothetical protein
MAIHIMFAMSELGDLLDHIGTPSCCGSKAINFRMNLYQLPGLVNKQFSH